MSKKARNRVEMIVSERSSCEFFFFLLFLSNDWRQRSRKRGRRGGGEIKRNKVEVSRQRDLNRDGREVSLNFLRAGRAGAWR